MLLNPPCTGLQHPNNLYFQITSYGVCILVEKRVSFVLTQPYIEAMDHLIREGVYISRAEVVKDALRRLFRHYEIRIYGAQDENNRPRPPIA